MFRFVILFSYIIPLRYVYFLLSVLSLLFSLLSLHLCFLKHMIVYKMSTHPYSLVVPTGFRGYFHPIISCFIRIQIGLTFLVPVYPVVVAHTQDRCILGVVTAMSLIWLSQMQRLLRTALLERDEICSEPACAALFRAWSGIVYTGVQGVVSYQS